MTSNIDVTTAPALAGQFMAALLKNLAGADISSVLPWVLDAGGNFHTRIHYGRAPVTIFTDDENGSSFARLEILLETQPLEPENSDMLRARVSRAELGEAAALADRLVQELSSRVRPHQHDISRLLQKFNNENR